MVKINTINNIDCVCGMGLLKSESVDLTVTSPPYDNLRTYNGFQWDFENVAKQLYRITKNGGVVVWVVSDATIKGNETATSFKQALFFKECGFNLHDTMIWVKDGGGAVGSNKCYTQNFEYMFVFSKGKPKTFNPIMIPCKTSGLSYKSTAKQITTDKNRVYKEMVINKEKVSPNIWDMAVAQNKTSHPAVFPEELVYKHMISWSNEGDVVMDILICF